MTSKLKYRIPKIFFRRRERVKLTKKEIHALSSLCSSKAFEHTVMPNGRPAAERSWRQLAEKLYLLSFDAE